MAAQPDVQSEVSSGEAAYARRVARAHWVDESVLLRTRELLAAWPEQRLVAAQRV
jgi:hypothetical protein